MTAIRGARVLITGAASGLGRRMALGVAARGGRPLLWDVNEERLSAVASELSAGANTYVCDISDREAVYEAAASALADGPIDVVINNAGVVNGKSFLELADEDIERSMRINVHGLFWMTKAFLPSMIERNRGHLVTVASAAGLVGVKRLSDYCASKWAAVGFDESLRMELKSSAPGVRTTVVCPFFIDTGMFEGVKSRFAFLLPILKEEKAAHKILAAIERNRPQLIMPPFVRTIPLVRLLPMSWFDAIANFMGINASMDEFVGRD